MTRKPKIDNALLKRLARTDQKRQEGTRSKRVRFLIVSEGIKTEPNYFIALRDNLPLGTLSIIEVQGLGKETIRIIDEAIAIRDRCQKKYDRIWAYPFGHKHLFSLMGDDYFCPGRSVCS